MIGGVGVGGAVRRYEDMRGRDGGGGRKGKGEGGR